MGYVQAQQSSNSGDMIVPFLNEMVLLTRELLNLSREQVELARRGEQRFLQQQQQQKEEFQQLLSEHFHLEGRCHNVQRVVRDVLGQTITDLTEFVEENGDELLDSEFVRSDMIDRYGALLNHLSAMYGMMKRLAAVDVEPGNQDSSQDFTY